MKKIRLKDISDHKKLYTGLSHLVKPKKPENDNKKAQKRAKTANETVK